MESKEFHDQLLLYRSRIIVLKSLQRETLEKIHAGHQGIDKCRSRVTASVWWPGVSQHVLQMVQDCPECVRNSTPRREPLNVSSLPDYPWQVFGTDLFELEGVNYLLVVDYFSRYPEVKQIKCTTSTAVIHALKAIFSTHGIPEIVRSDNGPQFSSQEFEKFTQLYELKHVTSSLSPQSNRQVERSVKTVKQMFTKSKDPYLALLNYRATPLAWCGLSPAELSMGRKIRTLVPQVDNLLIPGWTYMEMFKKNNQQLSKNSREITINDIVQKN